MSTKQTAANAYDDGFCRGAREREKEEGSKRVVDSGLSIDFDLESESSAFVGFICFLSISRVQLAADASFMLRPSSLSLAEGAKETEKRLLCSWCEFASCLLHCAAAKEKSPFSVFSCSVSHYLAWRRHRRTDHDCCEAATRTECFETTFRERERACFPSFELCAGSLIRFAINISNSNIH